MALTSRVVNTIFSIDEKYRSQSICVCCRSAKTLVALTDRTMSGTWKNQFKIANENEGNINEYIVFVVFWADIQRRLIGAYQSSHESTVNANNKTILALTEIPNGDSEFEAPNVYIQDTIHIYSAWNFVIRMSSRLYG